MFWQSTRIFINCSRRVSVSFNCRFSGVFPSIVFSSNFLRWNEMSVGPHKMFFDSRPVGGKQISDWNYIVIQQLKRVSIHNFLKFKIQVYFKLIFRFELVYVGKFFSSKNVMTILLSDLSLILDQDYQYPKNTNCDNNKHFLLIKSPLSSRKIYKWSFKPNYNRKSISNTHSVQTSITFEAESRKQ
jgi:hypothetical protein